MHAVVRTDRMFGTDNRGGLISLRYQPMTTVGEETKAVPTAIDNGNVVLIKGLENGEREIYVAETPADDDAINEIALVATPEVMYDERIRGIDGFYNEAGKVARGYYLHQNDIFSVTIEALDAAADPAVGNVVELTDGTKLHVVTGLTSGATKVGEIIAIDVVGRYTYYVIQVKH